MKVCRYIWFLIVLSAECFGQNGINGSNGHNGHTQYPFWNQTALSGEVGFRAHYRNQYQQLGSGFEEEMDGTLYGGHFLLQSKSFIVHPNLMDLTIDAEYNPEKVDRQYLIIPDRSEVRTLKRLNLGSTFFQEKNLTLNAFLNLSQNYINRENFTNSRTNREFWGAGLFYKNKTLPFSLTYQEGNWDQTEIETGRRFEYWQRNIKSRISKSFSSRDKHVLRFSRDEYIRREYNLDPRENIINYGELNSSVYFDDRKKYSLNAIISDMDQSGADELNRFQVFTNLILRLPENLRFTGNYSFFENRNPLYVLDQHRARANLEHRLFESLTTGVFAEYALNNHTLYKEHDNRLGFDINYSKKIPVGKLSVSYIYYLRDFDRTSDPVLFKVLNEEQVLSDDQITLLDKPFVDPASIVVKDLTGTIIYQPGFDYVIIEQNNFIEIQRIPGGQIANNSTVMVDYTTISSGSYKYTLYNNHFSVNLSLFKHLVDVYYRRAKQDYNHFEQTDLVVLNYYTQNLYGIQLNFDFARVGVEYDQYESSIIPYRLIRYFATMQWRFRSKLLLSLMGNVRNYLTIGDRKNELYADISGKAAYSFNPKTKLNLDIGYREQNGYQIDLNLLTMRTEFTMIVRSIYMTAGIEVYRRNYLNREIINFNGAYFSLTRKF